MLKYLSLALQVLWQLLVDLSESYLADAGLLLHIIHADIKR
jgi:hypothetical protein